jgi:PEGA domain
MRAAYLWGSVVCGLLLARSFPLQADGLGGDPGAPWFPRVPAAQAFPGLLDVDSEPSGAEAKTSLGGGCRTPCSFEVTAEGPFNVTFTQEGYEAATMEVNIEHAQTGVSAPRFAPNPVFVRLTPLAAPAPPRAAPKRAAAKPRAPRGARKSVPAAQRSVRPPLPPPIQPIEVHPVPGIGSTAIVPVDAFRRQ